MRPTRGLLLFLLLAVLPGCGGGGGGISGSPDQPATISVNIVESSANIETGETFQFHASVNNASDTTITWTVNGIIGGDSTVGTMSVDGLYTAPAEVPATNPVTVKATSNADKSKSDTATVTINLKFAISPTSVDVLVGQTQYFTATHEVDHWEVNGVGGGNETVGTVSAGLYTAPATVPNPATVTVRAFKQGDTAKTADASVNILASSSSLSITPSAATVAAGTTKQFTANLAVEWSVSSQNMGTTDPAVIGSITSGGLYTAPLYPPWTAVVTITATSKSDSNITASATVTVSFSTASLHGAYAVYYRGFDNAEAFFMVGRFDADGSGRISNGFADAHFPGDAYFAAIPFTGTYSVGADGRGSMDLSVLLQSEVVTLPMRFVISSATTARLIGFDDVGSGWGGMQKQAEGAQTAVLSGNYVYKLDGFTDQLSAVAAAGMFTATADGYLSSGVEDINLAGTVSNLTFTSTGNWALDPASGRGGMSLMLSAGPNMFYFYPVDDSTAFFITQGGGGAALGVFTKQSSSSFSNASLNGGVVFTAQGYTPGTPSTATTAAFAVGRFVSGGAGAVTEGVGDNNVNGVVGTAIPLSGTYSIAANGRATFALTAGSATNNLALYMIADNSAFYVVLDPPTVVTGQLLPAPGPFSTIRKGWAFTLRSTYIGALADATGAFLAADSGGPWTGAEDYNDAGALVPNQALTATYAVSTSNGRGTATISAGSASAHMVFYEVSSGGTLVLVGADNYPVYGFATRQY